MKFTREIINNIVNDTSVQCVCVCNLQFTYLQMLMMRKVKSELIKENKLSIYT